MFVAGPLFLIGAALLPVALARGDLETERLAYLAILVAFMLATWVDKVRIDPRKDRITRRKGFIIPISWGSLPLSDYCTRVEVKEKFKGGEDGSSGSYEYELILVGKKRLVLAKLKGLYLARRQGAKLAKAINVPLHSRIFGKRIVRQPELLDLPAAERWEREGKLYEHPVIPSGTGLRLSEANKSLTVKFGAQSEYLPFLLGMALFAALIIFLNIKGGSDSLPIYLFALVFFALLAYMAMTLTGSSKLSFGPDYISFRPGIWPFGRKLALRAIEDIVVTDGVDIMGHKHGMHVHLPNNKDDAQYLKRLIFYEVLQRYVSKTA